MLSCAIFMLVTGVYLLFLPGHCLTTPDEELNLRTTLSLLEGQRGSVPPLPGGFATRRGVDGKQYAQYGLGLPVAAAPWLAVGRMINPAGAVHFSDWLNLAPDAGEADLAAAADESTLRFLRVWLTVFAVFIAAATAVVFHALARRLGLSPRAALGAALLLAFCAYQWRHGRTFFTEPLTTLCLLSAFWAMLRARGGDALKWNLLGGAFWAYAVFTRPDALVTAPAALWLLCIDTAQETSPVRIDLRRLAAFAAPWLVVLTIVMLYNQYRFDSFFSTGYEDQAEGVHFSTPLLVGLHGFLLTPGRSLFFYSPPLLLALFGAAAFWRRDRWLAGGVYLLVGFHLVVMSMWQNWAGGYDWGPRHIYQITPFLMLPAAFALENPRLYDARWKRAIWALAIAFAVGLQLLGLAADPVAVIHDWLDRWPAVMVGAMPLSTLLLQFNIYLPHFSAPALHWQAIWTHGPDFLLLDLARHHSAWLPLYLLPAALIAWGTWIVKRNWQSG